MAASAGHVVAYVQLQLQFKVDSEQQIFVATSSTFQQRSKFLPEMFSYAIE